MKKLLLTGVLAASFAAGSAEAPVNFVSCPKCDKRMRISEDGREAFVNLDRIDPARKDEMAARARLLLARGAAVTPADPLTPLMGWSSWNTFAVDISEEIILGVARAMATNGLKAAGYAYVNIDDGFFDGHGPDGRLRFHPVRFPKGLKGTVDGIHALGLKAGIYSDAGANTCGSIWNADKGGVGAGLYGHDDDDCRLHFTELGFDFIKVDYCGGTRQKLDERTRYTQIAAAIQAAGRPGVRLNICRWAFPGTWAADLAGSWRTTRDIRANWKSVRDIVAENLYLSAYARPGHFNDLDMLEVGQIKGAVVSAFGTHGDTGLTLDEETTHFGMWCILSSPLVLGLDVRKMPPATMKLVTNPYLLRMNQDPLGLQAYVAARDGEAYVLVKDAEVRFGTSRYVALYNAGDEEHVFKVAARPLDLAGRIAAFDLVERADIGEFENELTVRVRPHAAKFYRFDAERRIDRERYEAETAWLSDYSEIGEGSAAPAGKKRRRAKPQETAGASGGVAVVDLGGFDTNDLIWRDVHVSTAGDFRLVFRCSSPELRGFSAQIDGGAPHELLVPATADGFTDVSVAVRLAKGSHTIRLSNATAPMPNVDCLTIQPITGATPVYETKDADVSSDAVRCRLAGTPVLDEDLFARRDFWKLANYDNRLGMEAGGVRDGVKGLCLDGSAKTCDTAWNAVSGRIPLKGAGRRYRLGFTIDTTITIKLPNRDGENWRSTIFWQGADGKELSKAPLAYFVPKGQRTDVSVYGDIPEGAVSFSLRFGFDSPNIGPANRVVFSGLSFEELAEVPSYAPEATFSSEVRAGGDIAWRADVPDGCAVRFQWRGAPTPGELAQKPFVGPDGTGGTFFDAPFRADAAAIQYRVLLRSNGKATPTLREVSGGQWVDRNWTLMGDVRPPRARRLSPSPTRNANETLRIEVKDATSTVLWDSLKVLVDGADRTAAFTRAGDVISLKAPSAGWAQGLHTAEVSVVDFHQNKAKSTKMFYVGDAPTTPKVTLRDDGITLIDGQPFFPIGLYAVCKRDFNGKNFDVAFKGLKEAGFNLAHTYGNSYAPDFLAAAAKYGIKLWVAARFPERRLIEEGRHNPSILAWYLGDDTSDHIPSELEADYDEAVKAVDPTRITVQADPILSSAGGPSRYADYVTATDGFLPEIYPVRNKEGDPTDKTCVAVTIRDMEQFHEDVRRHGDGKPRTCWAILQYFKGWSGWQHFPTREQLFATTFAAIIHGAHGVTWYTYGGFDKNEGVTSTPERWRNICDLATRLSELSPVLVERTPPQPAAPAILSGPKTDPLGQPAVTGLLKRHNGRNYLLTVNAAAEPVTAKLSVPGAKAVEVLYENRTCAAAGEHITDTFPPFAVHIYRY